MWIDEQGSTVLPIPECRRLLAVAARDTGIGRIGISTDHAPVVVPVNFAVRDRDIVVRIGPGLVSHAAPGALVAFEVDHIDLEAGEAWSVLARGLATLADADAGDERSDAPRPLVPEPGHKLLTIRPDVLTGRRFELRPTT